MCPIVEDSSLDDKPQESSSEGGSSGGGVAGGISSIGTMITQAADTTNKNINQALMYDKVTKPQLKNSLLNDEEMRKTGKVQRKLLRNQNKIAGQEFLMNQDNIQWKRDFRNFMTEAAAQPTGSK